MNKAQCGFSMAEVCISLFIGAFLLTGLVSTYTQSRLHYQQNQIWVDQQMELLWVNQLLVNAIHQAGFTPCARLNQLKTAAGIKAIETLGMNGSGLKLARMSETFTQVRSIEAAQRLHLGEPGHFKVSRPILVADCWHAEVQGLAAVEKKGGEQILTLRNPLVFNYQQPVYVGEWLEESWFVKASSATQSVLYYQRDKPEPLSSLLNYFTVNLKRNRLEFSLGSSAEQSINTMVWLRN